MLVTEHYIPCTYGSLGGLSAVHALNTSDCLLIPAAFRSRSFTSNHASIKSNAFHVVAELAKVHGYCLSH